jgi:hypothetical protein
MVRPLPNDFVHLSLEKELSHAEQAKQAYYSLLPNTPVSSELLEGLYAELAPETRKKHRGVLMVIGNLALELSSHEDIGIEASRMWNKQARSTLRTVANDSRVPVRRFEARQQDDFRPYLQPTVLLNRRELKERIQHTSEAMAETFYSLRNPGQKKELRGLMHVQAAIMAIGNLSFKGLIAHPSWARQKLYRGRVDGYAYRLDLAVESDGQELPKGQYNMQVSNRETPVNYHPDIAVLRPRFQFMEKDEHPDEVPSSFRLGLTAMNQEVIDIAEMRQLRRIQDNMLGILDDAGPVSQNRLLLKD